MLDPRQTVTLCTGLLMALGVALVIAVALWQPWVGISPTPVHQACQAGPDCHRTLLGLDPEKARRFASVFRS